LVLDAGGFFAAGLLDEYTQNTELDRQRTLVNLKAMELMQYDAVAIGDSEFNFGKDFLQEVMSKSNLTFLSCNIQSTKILPYIIKQVAGTKVGIIAVTGLFAKEKAGDLTFTEPKIAVKAAVEELRKNGVNLIVLLSQLGESADLDLINAVGNIDILIVGHSRKEESFSQINQTLVLRPSRQGRRLDRVSFRVENNKVTNYKVEELRLSDKILDDVDILSILPRCFQILTVRKKVSSVSVKTRQSQCRLFIQPG